MTSFISRVCFRSSPLLGFRCTQSLQIWEYGLPAFQRKIHNYAKPSLNALKIDQFRGVSRSAVCSDTIVPPAPLDTSALQIVKRRSQKKVVAQQQEGQFLTLAYATAYSYDLSGVRDALIEQKLYEPGKLRTEDAPDVVHATANYSVGDEPREIFIFREGAVVFWNCSDLEISNVLYFLKRHENESYPEHVVLREREMMPYMYQLDSKKCQLQEHRFLLRGSTDNVLERYTFSDAMAASVRLSAWEAALDRLAHSIRSISNDLAKGKQITLSREEVLRQVGELFKLRHRITVDSDLLDTPDFYWEQHELENLYTATTSYFSISRRTRVLNERLAHCVELMELLGSWLSDKHHVRLEWYIIALITVEVGFEIAHFTERYLPTFLS